MFVPITEVGYYIVSIQIVNVFERLEYFQRFIFTELYDVLDYYRIILLLQTFYFLTVRLLL